MLFRCLTRELLPVQAFVDLDKENLNKTVKSSKIVDGTLKTLRATDAMDIMKMLRARRKKRGSVASQTPGTLSVLSLSRSLSLSLCFLPLLATTKAGACFL